MCRPEGVPRLFDLVRVKDDNLLPVFYFALRDTLVANDLEQATRIAYGKTRHRVVTLTGQLIETSGYCFCFLVSRMRWATSTGVMKTTIVVSIRCGCRSPNANGCKFC